MFVAGVTALAIVAWNLSGPREVRRSIAPERMVDWRGHGSNHRVEGTSWFVHSGGDSATSPRSSTLRLLEDGKDLGPAHAVHDSVAAHGKGAFSHWGNTLFFSASDNSNPATNGRRYEAIYRLAPAPWLLWLAVATFVGMAAFAARPILRGRLMDGRVPLLPSALAVLAAMATATHWLPIGGRIDVAHGALPDTPRIGASTAGDRPGAVKLLPFERLVRPLLIVPSPQDGVPRGPVTVSHRGIPLRETLTIDEFRAAADAVFLDGDRIGGDGVLVYLPPGFTDDRTPLRIHHAVTVTPGAIAMFWACFGVSLVAAMVMRRTRTRPPRERARLAGAAAAAGAALALVSLNLAGLALPHRPPAPNSPSPEGRDAKPVWTERDLLERDLLHRAGETRADYAVRMNDLVAANVHHIWNYANASAFALHVPLRSNYVLSLLGETSPSLYRYTYAAWRPALERGVGMCSQKTLILVGILRDQGYDARIVQLDGHTVVTAEVSPGTWYVLDPDYGVSLRRDIQAIEADPESVRGAYRARLEEVKHPEPGFAAGTVVAFYAREGNHVEPKGANQMLGELWVVRENLAKWLKWLLPAMLLALAARLVVPRAQPAGK